MLRDLFIYIDSFIAISSSANTLEYCGVRI